MGKLVVFQKDDLGQSQIRALTQVFQGLVDFSPGRAVAKIHGEDGAVFVKRYRRSMKPWWKRLFRKPYHSPLFDEATVLAKLHELRYPSPEPLMYTESHRPGFHESLLLTRHLPGVPLATLAGQELRSGACLSLALLGRLHALGIAHGDCNPYNFLIDTEAYVLDFERSVAFTEAGGIEDFKKIMLRLRALGLGDSDMNAAATAYLDNAGVATFDAHALLAGWRDEVLLVKPTRWRPPQELHLPR